MNQLAETSFLHADYYLWAASLTPLGLIALYFARLAYQRYHDLNALTTAVRRMQRSEIPPPRLSFHTNPAENLWRSILRLNYRKNSTEHHEKLLQASTRISSASYAVDATAQELLNVVLGHTSSEVLASAVILNSASSSPLRIEASEGLSKKILENPLLMAFDGLLYPKDNQVGSEWGYILAKESRSFDFSAIGIELSLVTPLRDSRGVCGGIWLGFQTGSSALTPQRKAFIQAIAEHAASSFYAAHKAEENERAAADAKDFLLGLSHDLRAPGNSALFAVQDLLSGEIGALTPKQHLNLCAVKTALQDQQGILSDLLDFAKYQKGFLEAKREIVSLKSALGKIIEQYSQLAARKNLSFHCEVIPDTRVFVERRHLQRIVQNLLSNALKYTEKGNISVTFTAKDAVVETFVTDTGIGVPKEEELLLFNEFSRCRNSLNATGSGLGLALSKALAELNSGELIYRRNTGFPGSTFGISIPRYQGAESKETKKPTPLVVNSVLLVDDDPAACRSNIRLLRNLANNVVPASTLAEAKELLHNIQPDLLVCDYYLDNGHTSGELIQILAASRNHTSIVILTGSSGTTELEELAKLPNVRILEKPSSRKELSLAIESLSASQRRAKAAA